MSETRLVKHYCDCDHLRMEPGASLYQRETVYLAADVDALLRQREEELAEAKCGEALCGHDHSTQYWELRANNAEQQLAAMTGPGYPYNRWQALMAELDKRFPDPQPYDSSHAPEAHYLEAIDRLITQLAAAQECYAKMEEELKGLDNLDV